MCMMLLACFLSCTKEVLQQNALPGRTLLVYMGGDNNLSVETDSKIDALLAGWSSECSGRLLIYQDRSNDVPRLLEVKGGTSCKVPYLQEIEFYPEENSASEEVFKRVIGKMVEYAPAKSYGLLLFSHGTGWLPPGAYEYPETFRLRSVVRDKGNEMSIPGFAEAIPDKLFDYIILEACFMGGVEVAYELRKKTDYLLVSAAEIFSPGFTDIYPDKLECLFRQAETGLPDFAEGWFEHVRSRPGNNRAATVSVIRTCGLDSLLMSVRPVGIPYWNAKINGIQGFDRNESKQFFFDLADYYQRMATPEQWAVIDERISKTILFAAATKDLVNIPIRKHCGLTTYIRGGKYTALDESHKTMQWCRNMEHN